MNQCRGGTTAPAVGEPADPAGGWENVPRQGGIFLRSAPGGLPCRAHPRPTAVPTVSQLCGPGCLECREPGALERVHDVVLVDTGSFTPAEAQSGRWGRARAGEGPPACRGEDLVIGLKRQPGVRDRGQAADLFRLDRAECVEA